jgi:hypothetical protein
MQNLKGKYDMGGVASSSRTCILCTELELKKVNTTGGIISWHVQCNCLVQAQDY